MILRELGLRPRDNGVIVTWVVFGTVIALLILVGCSSSHPDGVGPHPAGWYEGPTS